jgi:hypothetical protein
MTIEGICRLNRVGLAVAAACAFAAFAPIASAAPLNLTSGDTIKIDRVGAVGGAFGGGEFRATGVSVLDGSSGSFLTFCVEYNEHIAINGTYYVDISTEAVKGGVGVAGYGGGDPDGVSLVSDPLSKGTAWLYTQYSSNLLVDFTGTAADANSLQLAIWSLENELGEGTTREAAFEADMKAGDWEELAQTEGASWSDTGRVRILNLYDTRTEVDGGYAFSGNHQDQLYITPIPEPETYAMLLAGLGLMGFVARRRKANRMAG